MILSWQGGAGRNGKMYIMETHREVDSMKKRVFAKNTSRVAHTARKKRAMC